MRSLRRICSSGFLKAATALALMSVLFTSGSVVHAKSTSATAAAGARFHMRVLPHRHHMKQQTSEAGEDDDGEDESTFAVTCRTAESDAVAVEPTLSIDCPSMCRDSNFCIYYPQEARGNCTSRYGSSCYDGDTCTYECLTTVTSDGSWYITVYDNDTTFQRLDAVNSAFAVPTILVNASVVAKMDPLLQSDEFIKQL